MRITHVLIPLYREAIVLGGYPRWARVASYDKEEDWYYQPKYNNEGICEAIDGVYKRDYKIIEITPTNTFNSKELPELEIGMEALYVYFFSENSFVIGKNFEIEIKTLENFHNFGNDYFAKLEAAELLGIKDGIYNKLAEDGIKYYQSQNEHEKAMSLTKRKRNLHD